MVPAHLHPLPLHLHSLQPSRPRSLLDVLVIRSGARAWLVDACSAPPRGSRIGPSLRYRRSDRLPNGGRDPHVAVLTALSWAWALCCQQCDSYEILSPVASRQKSCYLHPVPPLLPHADQLAEFVFATA